MRNDCQLLFKILQREGHLAAALSAEPELEDHIQLCPYCAAMAAEERQLDRQLAKALPETPSLPLPSSRRKAFSLPVARWTAAAASVLITALVGWRLLTTVDKMPNAKPAETVAVEQITGLRSADMSESDTVGSARPQKTDEIDANDMVALAASAEESNMNETEAAAEGSLVKKGRAAEAKGEIREEVQKQIAQKADLPTVARTEFFDNEDTETPEAGRQLQFRQDDRPASLPVDKMLGKQQSAMKRTRVSSITRKTSEMAVQGRPLAIEISYEALAENLFGKTWSQLKASERSNTRSNEWLARQLLWKIGDQQVVVRIIEVNWRDTDGSLTVKIAPSSDADLSTPGSGARLYWRKSGMPVELPEQQ